MNWKFIRLIDRYVGIPVMYLLAIGRMSISRRRIRVRSSPRRMLLVKFWGVGNIFMMLPAVRSLRTAYPHSETDLLTMETSKEAATALGIFDAVYAIDTTDAVTLLTSTFRKLRQLRKKNYDLIVDFEQFAKFSALFVGLVGCRDTFGYRTHGQHRHYLYSHPVEYENHVHITQSYHALTAAAGAGLLRPADYRISEELPGERSAREALGQKLPISQNGLMALLHVGTSINFVERRWPLEYFVDLANLLIEQGRFRVFLTGSADEAELTAAVFDRIRNNKEYAVDMGGELDFREYFALLRCCDLVVTSDTAPVHMASVSGVPVVGLYGPNTPALYGPWDRSGIACYEQLSCSPCITNFNAKTHVCRHRDGKGACMRKILPADVYARIRTQYLDCDAPLRLEKLRRLKPCSV